MLEEVDVDDDSDLHMDAEAIFIEKQSSNVESTTVLADDPKVKGKKKAEEEKKESQKSREDGQTGKSDDRKPREVRDLHEPRESKDQRD